LIRKGYTPPVHDFSITTANGDDITDEVLSADGFTFLLVAYNMSKSDSEGLKKATDIASFCKENGHKFYCLTATSHSEIEHIKQNLELNYEFCITDGTTLKTIIRANPGLVLLHKGIVLGKWHFNDMPETSSLKQQNLISYALKLQAQKATTRLTYILIIAFIFFAFVLFQFRNEEKMYT
jgi:dihydroorotase